MKTLIYVGAHQGNSLQNFIHEYDKIFAFEANPNFCEILKSRFQNYPHVKIINAAVCEKHEEIVTFNISKNNGDSSSLLDANPENELFTCIKPNQKIQVKTVNLYNFCIENNIDIIDSYISDLQGYDFIVLKTLKPLLDKKVIKQIQCEVEKNDKSNIYINKNVESQNKEKNFDQLLSKNYTKTSKGWGYLKEGVFNEVPDNWCEFDVQWKLKN